MTAAARHPSGDGLRRLGAKDEALWLLQRLEPRLGLANIPLVLRVERSPRWWPLQQALDWVAGRHPPLRSCFPAPDGQPLRRVLPPGTRVPLEVGTTSEATLAADVAACGRAPFDLGRQPPIRTDALLLPDGGAVLVFTVNHIAFDALSSRVFLDELTLAYDSFAVAGRPPDGAPPPPPEPEDEPPVDAATLRWWVDRLAGAHGAAMRLGNARPEPAQPTFGSGLAIRPLSGQAYAGATALRKRLGLTENIVLLAGYCLLLLRHGAGPDLVVSCPVSTRRGRDDQRRIGFYLHTLAVRLRADPAAGFDRLAGEVRDAFLASLEHMEVPFEAVLPQLPDRQASWRAPLFRHAFNYWLTRQWHGSMGGGGARILDLEFGMARLDMELNISRTDEEVVLKSLFSTDAIDRWQAEAMLERFDTLLCEAAADPGRPIGRLPFWGGRDTAVVAAANRTDRSWPGTEGTVLGRVVRQAATTPAAVALVDGDEQSTYRDLVGRAAAVAERLGAHAIGPGSLVALPAVRGAATAAAALGTWAAGAAFVPVDPGHPPERIAFQLQDAGVDAVLVPDQARPGLPPASLAGRRLVELPTGTTRSARPVAAPHPEALAYVIYTSGSTGRPKGVEIRHRALDNVVAHFAERLDAGPETTMLWLASFAFDISLLELLLPLACGGRVVTAGDEAQTKPELLIRLVEDHGVTVVQATPTTWRLLAPQLGRRLAGVLALSGGEPISPALARRLLDGGVRLLNVYGPTEATIWATAAEIVPPVGHPVDIGRPIANLRVHLLDEAGQPQPPGLPGELCLAGVGLANGYRDRPELTAERFAEVAGLGRLYRTGDLARWRPDGGLDMLGRSDRQVKLRGHRLELAEVEAVLEEHPAVAAAAVVLSGDPTGDEGALLATVQGEDGDGLAGTLYEHARRLLPPWALPARITVTERLPRTPVGKVDYQAVARAAGRRHMPATATGAGHGNGGGTLADGGPDAVPGALLGNLVGLWQELLGDPGLGADANFFLEGGHSLLAARLVGRAEELTGASVPLAAVFDAPTPAELARLLQDAAGDATPPTTRGRASP
jgi:amino acid adenylation domain-containing protein